MKILILTQPLRTNYGGLLQAYALQTVLKRMGHDVVTDKKDFREPTLWFVTKYLVYRFIRGGLLRNEKYLPVIPCILTKKKYNIISKNTERFISNHIQTVDFFKGKRYPEKNEIDQYDMFVVGSDQVWRKEYNQYVENYFFDFLKGRKDKKRMVYAASFGVESISSNKDKKYKKCFMLLKDVEAISVREDSAVKILKEQANIDAIHVLDPTLLLEEEDYLALIEEEDQIENGNILMSYILDKNEQKSQLVNQVSTELGLNILEVMPEVPFSANLNGDLSKSIYPSVSKWLSGFRDAKYVVTDSFHGAAFAIIFNKPFIVIANENRGLSRFTSLLRIFGIENRMIFRLSDLDEKLLFEIDYSKINSIKKEWKNKSISFLECNIY